MEEKVMTPINKIEPISRIIPSQQSEKTEPITIKSMKQDLLALQYRAWKYKKIFIAIKKYLKNILMMANLHLLNYWHKR